MQDGQPEVVHEPLQRGEDLLGGRRVEGGRRLVEQEDLRVHGEDRADGHALPLAAGERAQRPVPQVGQPEQVEGLLDALPHDGTRQAEALHAVRELLLDEVGDEPGQRVLADDADDVGELARRMGSGVAAGDRDPSGEQATREVRDETVDRAQQRRLAGAGRPDDQAAARPRGRAGRRRAGRDRARRRTSR